MTTADRSSRICTSVGLAAVVAGAASISWQHLEAPAASGATLVAAAAAALVLSPAGRRFAQAMLRVAAIAISGAAILVFIAMALFSTFMVLSGWGAIVGVATPGGPAALGTPLSGGSVLLACAGAVALVWCLTPKDADGGDLRTGRAIGAALLFIVLPGLFGALGSNAVAGKDSPAVVEAKQRAF